MSRVAALILSFLIGCSLVWVLQQSEPLHKTYYSCGYYQIEEEWLFSSTDPSVVNNAPTDYHGSFQLDESKCTVYAIPHGVAVIDHTNTDKQAIIRVSENYSRRLFLEK